MDIRAVEQQAPIVGTIDEGPVIDGRRFRQTAVDGERQVEGAMETFTLPRSGIVVGYPKALIVRPNGNVVGRGVAPYIVIATPIVESPDDPVLQQALAATNRRR